jgi:hypothetical protein
MYGFTYDGSDPSANITLTAPEQDVAGFMLVRGPYAWLGWSWMGCQVRGGGGGGE